MTTKEKGKEQTIPDIMMTIASSYLANNCKGCPFWDIAGSCDTIPLNCSWLGLYRHYSDDNAPTVEYPFYQEAYQTGYEEGKNERPQANNNAELFKQIFSIYATEVWSMSEADFLKWLNQQVPQFEIDEIPTFNRKELEKAEERPQGDSISREALKNYARKVMYEKNATNFSLLKVFDEIIDNAPTVETNKIEYQAYNEGFKDGVEQGIKLSETPGEWINQFIGGNECVMCSECKLHFDIGTNYCPNCGAKMQKRGIQND